MDISGGTSTKVIRVHETTWIRLYNLKTPGESNDTVIRKLLSTYEAKLRISEEK